MKNSLTLKLVSDKVRFCNRTTEIRQLVPAPAFAVLFRTDSIGCFSGNRVHR